MAKWDKGGVRGGFPLVPFLCKGGVRGGFSFKILKIPPLNPPFKKGGKLGNSLWN